MDDLVSPLDWRESRLSEVEIQRSVTQIGLEFSLVTKWTAFVAVSERSTTRSPKSS